MVASIADTATLPRLRSGIVLRVEGERLYVEHAMWQSVFRDLIDIEDADRPVAPR
jgi:hypothetical protein